MNFRAHYHLQVEANSKKNCTKKPMLFLAALGKTGSSHDIFFKFSLGPFESFDVKWKLHVKFWDLKAGVGGFTKKKF